ncbi:hypothetical protein [Ancylobacter sp. G4_0304]|uniref:hypothetical protein n=1 Tax=Ancylobacter sp. G4_0304 TaxID=3114289 RepID=UPI0039C718B0
MIVQSAGLLSAAVSPSARAFPHGVTVCGISTGCIDALRRDFAGRRGAVHFRKEGRAIRGGAQEPTDRGPDKRPQGAALSVGCFCLCFSLIAQRAAPARKVRGAVNALPILCFSHIAGAGDG